MLVRHGCFGHSSSPMQPECCTWSSKGVSRVVVLVQKHESSRAPSRFKGILHFSVYTAGARFDGEGIVIWTL